MTTATMKTDTLFSISGASVVRSGRVIVDQIELELRRGEIILLKGANGAGKTTLLRALAGLLPLRLARGRKSPPPESAIYFGHLDGVKATLTISENLHFWAALYGASRDKVGAALTSIALDVDEDRRAGSLSAGQKRRLGLARLLLSEKPLWLLDEPTASMDEASARRFLHLIDAHRRAGGGGVIATHDRLNIDGARQLRLAPPERGR